LTGLKRSHRERFRPINRLGGEFPGHRDAPFLEPYRYAALALGALGGRSWRGEDAPADFFGLKGVLEALARGLGSELSFAPAEEPFLHPGRSAAVSVGEESAGWLGELHPLVCRAWDLEAAVAFEIDAAPLLGAAGAGEEAYEDVTTFPAVYQDLAVVVPADVSSADVRAAVLAGGGELLHATGVFDLYEGEQVGEGRKSLALGLEFRAADRTLTDSEVADLREAIRAELEGIGGSLRE
jgi:phenylalanyl-tRNA synthetase beta chain